MPSDASLDRWGVSSAPRACDGGSPSWSTEVLDQPVEHLGEPPHAGDSLADLAARGGLADAVGDVPQVGHRRGNVAFEHVGVEVSDAQIVQVDQKLEFHQAIKEGDRLYCDVAVESVRRAHGTDIIMTRQTVTNEAGDVMQETYTTLAGRAGEGEKGFTDGVA